MTSAAAWLCAVLLAVAPTEVPDFRTQIVPVLTKAGCNSGACHGAAAGRGGFHLSLFGSDPDADYDAIVHAFEGRRVNLTRPEASLVLRKPTGDLEHGGEQVLDPAGAGAARLLAWITAGVPRGDDRRLARLKIQPARIAVERTDAAVPIQVIAHYRDGTQEDVTLWTSFASSDPSAVVIDDTGVAQVRKRGQHVVTARFLDRIVPMEVVVPFSDAALDLSQEPRANWIDQRILEKLESLRIPASPAASDTAWLRRVSLDLTGRLPTPEEAARFLERDAETRREAWIDGLLQSEAFTDYWTWKFARLLRMHSLPHETEAFDAYHRWLREQLAHDVGFDSLARQLLTSTGDSHRLGPANFGRMVGDPRAEAELIGEVFLGVRLGCANCHNHPLDRWTQDDFHGLAAIFSRLDRSRHVQLLSRGEVTNVRTGQPATPRIPGERDLAQKGDHRHEVAEWVLDDTHHYFARATVNRLWSALFGRGLIEPTDDLRETQLATHPELLEQLTEEFVSHGYSIRHVLRLMASSHAYARSDEVLPGNANDDCFYSRYYRRPLSPEVLVDAIVAVTDVPESYENHQTHLAVRVIDPVRPAPSLDLLGRCQHVMGCDLDGNDSQGLAAQLYLLNGDLINRKLRDPSGRFQRMLEQHASTEAVIEEFCARAWLRRPSQDELTRWKQRLATDFEPSQRLALEDFVWSLLNSREFRENH